MKTIHKQVLSLKAAQVIEVPHGAVFLTVQMQDKVKVPCIGIEGYTETDRPVIWYECHPERVLQNRTIVLIGTGHDMPDTHTLKYLATVQQGPMIWHFYEAVQ